MGSNNFDSGCTVSRVWNVGKETLKAHGSGGLRRNGSARTGKLPRYKSNREKLFKAFILLVAGIFIAFSVYPVSTAYAAKEAAPFTGLSKPPFDLSRIIEKAEHLPVLENDRYVVKDKTYEAAFGSEGVAYIPVLPGNSQSSQVFFNVSQIALSAGRVLWSSGTVTLPVKKENTLLYQRTPDITEVYEVLRQGVEQSWILKKNPGADPLSDLRIVMDVETSLTGKMTSEMEIEFVDEDGAPRVKYSKATIIDANGKILVVAPSWDAENSRIVLKISGEWLAEAAYPVMVDPLIGTNIQVNSLTTADNYPAIAFDGTNYLIVWQSGTPNATGTGTTAIRGVRVSNSGTILDATPLTIGDTVGEDDEFPSVAYDSLNSRFIVVWMNWNNATDADVYRNTVTTTGSVATPAILVSQTNRILAYPTVACCDVNDRYYVIMGSSGAGATNFTQYIGRTVNRTTHAVSNDNPASTTVSSGTITPDTEPRSAPRLYSLSPTQYLLAWETFGVDANGDVSANMVTVTTTPSYTWGTQVSVAANAGILERYPRAAFDGTNALIVYQQGATTAADIYSRFVTPGANSLTLGTIYPVSTVAGNGQMYPDVAYNAGSCSATPIDRYMVVWQDYRNSAANPDIYGAPISTAGTVEAELAISTDATYIKERPVIAADSGSCGYMVAWSDNRNSGTTSSDIYAQRVGYPNINNLSPTSGFRGITSISINGMNFGTDPGAGNRSTATNNVKINGNQVSDIDITVWSDTVIDFTIPAGTTPGTYPVTVTAGSWTSNGSDLTVNNDALQVTTSSPPNGYQWLSYGTNLSATGGVTPYSWSIISGSLPGGLTLDSGTGLISGTPSAFGTFNFTVRATDSTTPTPQTADQPLSITVYGLTSITITDTSGTPVNPMIKNGETFQFKAKGTYSDLSVLDISSISPLEWKTSNSAVATIGLTTGLATGVGPGTATVCAVTEGEACP